MSSESDRARELEREALRASEESRKKAAEARERIDEQLRGFLGEVDDETENTGLHRLDEIMKKAAEEKVPPVLDESTPPTLRVTGLDAATPRNERVIVVEDDADIREVLASELRNEGYHVRVAVDGLDALEKILKDYPLPDLVILDLGLPYLDGIGVLAALRSQARTRDLPYLVISAGANIRRMMTEAPGFAKEHVFAKPFDSGHLFQVVRERIAEWRATPKP